MGSLPTGKTTTACLALVCLMALLSGCGGGVGGDFEAVTRESGALTVQDVSLTPSDPIPAAGEATPEPPGAADGPAGPAPTATRTMPESDRSPVQADAGSDGNAAAEAPSSDDAGVGLTMPGSRRLAERPRHNPEAADLLDHWGHRRTHGMVEGLALSDPAASDSAVDLQALRTAAQGSSETPAPDPHDDDKVDVLGVHRGVTYGRWSGGHADTLAIEFDLSRMRPAIRDDPAFRALLERAGKVWSHRIADTWRVWERPAGDLKGWLQNGSLPDLEVRAAEGGETSTGLEIAVADRNLPEGVIGWSKTGVQPSGDAWEPHFGSIEIDRTHLREAGEAALFATLAHEIGHVLGAWMGDREGYDAHTDSAAGTWRGPNVVAVHGGPAPFQDAADPQAWVDGERHPLASAYDFAHSGVCVSLLSYCRQNAALPAFLPHAIDLAFLADLGMTVTQATDRPETYGLAGWTNYAAFTLSLSRELQIALAEPQPYYDGAVNPWHQLDVIDLLQVEVDAFGYRSTGDVHLSHTALGLSGTARYAGGLIGGALDRQGMPPVTGDATLTLDLGTLDGTASFTSLSVYPDGRPETFAGGALHYPLALSGNTIAGTATGSTLQADFYGPGHEAVAGVLHDPRAGLLASFGAATDDRPSRQDVIAAADYLAGTVYRHGAATGNGWYQYRCETAASCQSSHYASNAWTDWTATPRRQVLAATAAWAWRDTSRPDTDRGAVRTARLTTAATDGARGRYAVDGYAATLEHAAFAVGFEQYTDEWAASDGISPGSGNVWAGFQGSLAHRLPGGVARWSGPMLGYQWARAGGDNPLVEGLATVNFSLSDNRVDVLFSEVRSRDRQRAIPDFGYRNLQAAADGTFAGFQSGSVEGAFFGPAHQEAAGSFHHNAARVTGSFGARRLPDTVTLEASGTYRRVEGTDGAHFYALDNWGFWGRQFQENVFGAFVDQATRQEGRTTYYDEPFGRIEGTPSRHNPVAGTAVWYGKVSAFDTHSDDGWTPVSGTARLAVDFGSATVDVDFTDFEAGHGDVSWRSLRLRVGAFSHTRDGSAIEGAFYGSDHQGAAGTFHRDRLQGVFGAVRN